MINRFPLLLARMSGRARIACAVLSGALIALSQPPFSLPVFLVLMWPVLIWLLDGATTIRSAALTGLAAGTGFFMLSLSWIVEPFLVDIARDGWMAPFAIVLLSVGLALFWALPFGFARWLFPGPGSGARIVVLAGAMALGEYARAHVFTGFPWSLLAYGWSESPILQITSLFGPYMLGFLTLSAAGLLALLRPIPTLAAVALLGAMWSFGMQRLDRVAPARPDNFTVRLLQPNAEQRLKWQPDMIPVFYRRQLDLSAAEGSPDVVVWPEAAVPFLLEDRADLSADIVDAAGVPVIVGVRQYTGDAWYNALSVLNRDGSIAASYQKAHLVPFGEYMPFAALFRNIGIEALASRATGGFSAGPGPRVIRGTSVPAFLPLICYEAIFPNGMKAPGPRPEWILQVTNDAWFGTFSGPYQHLAQARSRAIEQGLPLARSANTGISAMIDPYGRIVASLELGKAGKVDAALPAALPPTLYSRAGDLPFIAFILFVTLLPLVARRVRQSGTG